MYRHEKKRFRNEDGTLTLPLSEIKKLTRAEGEKYYTKGNIYVNQSNGCEYVHCGDDGMLIQFISFDNRSLFIPLESCGTFLPNVASEAAEIIKQHI